MPEDTFLLCQIQTAIVGGLVGLLKPRGTIGIYGSIKNFDDCSNVGYYIISGGTGSTVTNSPGIDYGILLFVNGTETGASSLQCVFDTFNEKIAYRMKNSSGIWQGWTLFSGQKLV